MITERRAVSFFVILLLALVIYLAYITFSICSYGSVNEITKADAAIVLGAKIKGGKPLPVFEERINHGIWLYKNGYVDKLIFTGGINTDSEYSESSTARDFALKNSVPDDDIFIEERSKTTQENLFYAAQTAKAKGITTVIIVSDPIHMKRAMLIAKDNNLTAYSSPTPSTKYITLKTKLPFLASEVFFYIVYTIYRLF
jgi:uncharacterized SAM-binding protein YcdF (DUF218 family)